MEMEVVTSVPTSEFNFDSSCSSPYMTAPSSPQRFGNFFFSAPTSPTRASAVYQEFNDLALISATHEAHRNSASAIPFKWEEKPGIPKNKATQNIENTHGDENDEEDQNFEFNFSGQLDRASLSAEELFDGGKIKPLKPPPRLQLGKINNEGNYSRTGKPITSPRSPRSSSRISQGKKIVQEVLMSPKAHRKKDFDPFEAAIEETRKKGKLDEQEYKTEKRGRERASTSSSIRKGTRSLSPLRVSDNMFDDKEEEINSSQTTSSKVVQQDSKPTTSSTYSSILSAISFSKGNRKWKLKDLLLFRSASEGRATTGKDPLKKYSILSKKVTDDDVKNLSFRSTESAGSVSSRRRGPVSAHELHYTVNRAVSEEMRKKTFLPYKQGLLGCLGFNPGVHEISRSFRSFTRE